MRLTDFSGLEAAVPDALEALCELPSTGEYFSCGVTLLTCATKLET